MTPWQACQSRIQAPRLVVAPAGTRRLARRREAGRCARRRPAGRDRSAASDRTSRSSRARARRARRRTRAAAKLEIHELPAARGCTYVAARARLRARRSRSASAFGDAEMKTAAKLGVTEKEIDEARRRRAGRARRRAARSRRHQAGAGKAVRNLGEEGKKKGMITTLPLALGRLQSARRDSPGADRRAARSAAVQVRALVAESAREIEARSERRRAHASLRGDSFGWVGPATMKEFQWFSGLGVKAAKDAVAPLELAPIEPGSDRLLLAGGRRRRSRSSLAPSEPQYALVSSLDSISAARRDVSTLVDEKDREKVAKMTFGERPGSAPRRSLGARDSRSRPLDRLLGVRRRRPADRLGDVRGKEGQGAARRPSRRRRPTCATSSATRARSASTARRAVSRSSRPCAAGLAPLARLSRTAQQDWLDSPIAWRTACAPRQWLRLSPSHRPTASAEPRDELP